jgi:hypothetical protein
MPPVIVIGRLKGASSQLIGHSSEPVAQSSPVESSPGGPHAVFHRAGKAESSKQKMSLWLTSILARNGPHVHKKIRTCPLK